MPFSIKNTMKKMRDEDELMRSFRWISWHQSLLLRELSLKRVQRPSLLYLTWLSLPFLVVFRSLWFLPHIHVLLVPGYTLCPGTGI